MMRAQYLLKLFYLSMVDPKDESGLSMDFNTARQNYAEHAFMLLKQLETLASSVSKKEVQLRDRLQAEYDSMRLNHNDMSGIYHGMMAEQFKKAYQGEKKNMWLMASDPRVYTSTLIKKEE